MKTSISPVLTKRERDILALSGDRQGCKHLSNAEIARELGISVGSVKISIYNACVKLGARTRDEAVVFALKRGEITLADLYSINEIAEHVRSLRPEFLRKIAYLLRQGLERGYLQEDGEDVVRTDSRQEGTLTKAERDVLVLAAGALTNDEIADRLCISVGSVRKSIYRACRKLGVRKKATAVTSALLRGEISPSEYSPDDLIMKLAPLGAETIEKIAELLDQKLVQEPVPTVANAAARFLHPLRSDHLLGVH